MEALDAVVVGAGPNGLVAAVRLAAAGLSVRVVEAAASVGGGARTAALTLPGFRHDPCSAVHPLGVGSPALRALQLERHGLRWIHPTLPLAHPLPGGRAAILDRSVAGTAAWLTAGTGATQGEPGVPGQPTGKKTARPRGAPDGGRYRRLLGPLLGRWDDLADDVLRPVAGALPRHPLLLARFALRALPPASLLARAFAGDQARALLAGLAAHAIAPLSAPLTGGFAVLLALAGHDHNWPFAAGGSQAIADALHRRLVELGGDVVTGWRVHRLEELPRARVYLLDVAPTELVRITGDRLPARYRARLARYRPGAGVFKIDYALAGPVPWTSPEARSAGTVHVGASFGEVAAALDAVAAGRAPDPPFLVTAQPSLFDPSRAPAGSHTFWVYAHCPNGYTADLTGAVERQLERFAPGFRDLVLARAVAGPAVLERDNPNNAGGDIAVGAVDGLQALFRPVVARVPYATPDPAIYLCSAATPPGPGVHGMCGWHAAGAALRRRFGLRCAVVEAG